MYSTFAFPVAQTVCTVHSRALLCNRSIYDPSGFPKCAVATNTMHPSSRLYHSSMYGTLLPRLHRRRVYGTFTNPAVPTMYVPYIRLPRCAVALSTEHASSPLCKNGFHGSATPAQATHSPVPYMQYTPYTPDSPLYSLHPPNPVLPVIPVIRTLHELYVTAETITPAGDCPQPDLGRLPPATSILLLHPQSLGEHQLFLLEQTTNIHNNISHKPHIESERGTFLFRLRHLAHTHGHQ